MSIIITRRAWWPTSGHYEIIGRMWVTAHTSSQGPSASWASLRVRWAIPSVSWYSLRSAAESPYLARDDDQTMNANSFNHFQYAKARSEEICGGA